MADDDRVLDAADRDADARDTDDPEANPVTAVAPGVTDAPDDVPARDPIEPESVTLEHAAFVLLGAALTLVVVASAL